VISYDIDANGILNVSAQEKATGKVEKITITNEKGRLSQEEIEKMVKDAEKYKSEDEAIKRKVDAKNSFEHYIYTVRNTSEEEKLKEHFEEEDKKTIRDACAEHQQWLDSNQDASAEEYEARHKDLEKVFQPIMSKVYQKTGAGSQANMPGEKGSMPTDMGGQAEPNAGVDDLD
jgi:heat shock protein 1/8